jgi:hypothetical protein
MLAFCSRVLRAIVVVISPLCILSLMGCQNYIFHPFDLDGDNNSVSLDAKQRLVLVTRQGGRYGNKRVVCAEPSPDVYSVTAASVAGSGAFSAPTLVGGSAAETKAGLAVAAARNEAGASIAMRTQTIQLLRDGLYRACEAYMNGAIDEVQYNVILLNIDRLMITLLGIDAIGGTPKVPATAISANLPPASAKTPGEGGAEAELKEAKEGGTRLVIETIQKGEDKATQVQAQSIAEIVKGAGSYSSLPMLCVSLMGSGQLNSNDPNRRSLRETCDFLVNGYAKNVLTDGYVKASRGKY